MKSLKTHLKSITEKEDKIVVMIKKTVSLS